MSIRSRMPVAHTPDRATCLVRSGIVIATMASALCAPLRAIASFRCVDEGGHVYVVPRTFGESSGMHCALVVDAPTVPSAQPARAAGEATAAQVAAALGLAEAAPPRTGSLVLEDSRTAAPIASIGGRLVLLPSPGSTLASTAARPSAELQALIESVAQRYGHDVHLLNAIIQVESNYDPNAVSPKGAIGLMQVMPATASGLGMATPQRTLFDPLANLNAGARFLRDLMDKFPDRQDLAVAAYNAGEGAVMRYNREIPPFPETQAYVRNVMERYRRQRRD